jgi:hypothetical protein
VVAIIPLRDNSAAKRYSPACPTNLVLRPGAIIFLPGLKISYHFASSAIPSVKHIYPLKTTFPDQLPEPPSLPSSKALTLVPLPVAHGKPPLIQP